jgi:hypothetical protein
MTETPPTEDETRPAPPPAGVSLTPEQLRARAKRNVAIGLALLAFVVLVFAVTMLKYVGNMQQGAGY